jgi:hypothetical protein
MFKERLDAVQNSTEDTLDNEEVFTGILGKIRKALGKDKGGKL